jgi:hypothetical protein
MPTPRPDHFGPTPARPESYRFSGTPAARPSPLQNRVTPTGEIVAEPFRGMLMGNRGCIHDADRRLGVSRWRTKMWISCVLRWGHVRRDVMPVGRWTALFFLDEATALSAGHRPCGYCRRADHLAFGEAWREAQGLPRRLRAAEMDAELHRERVDQGRRKLTWQAALGDLPDGVMVSHDTTIALVHDQRLLPWSFAGYGAPIEMARSSTVRVLTPPKIVGALAAGYRPLVHPSAGATSMRTLN